MTHLHIFALNEPVEVSHTNLTRQNGEVVDLPPLAEWLGVDTLDTDEIELFPVDELAGMALSDYIALAFAPEDDLPGDVATRLNALTGAVVLVPDRALSAPPKPGPQATQVASVPLARADNSASLPKANTAPVPAPAAAPQDHEASPQVAVYALIGMAILAALIYFVGWN